MAQKIRTEVECLSVSMKKGEDNSEFSGVTVAVD